MHLIEILLPLGDNEGRPFGPEKYAVVRECLATRFGGMTAFTRSPAEGTITNEDGRKVRDDIVVFEVMAKTVDAAWWRDYRRTLEREFSQDQIIVRASAISLL